MKGILVLALLAIAGCSSYPTIEELEARAVSTGDWSAVEKRERLVARRNSRSGIACPAGTTGYCEAEFGQEDCSCVESDVLRSYFSN